MKANRYDGRRTRNVIDFGDGFLRGKRYLRAASITGVTEVLHPRSQQRLNGRQLRLVSSPGADP